MIDESHSHCYRAPDGAASPPSQCNKLLVECIKALAHSWRKSPASLPLITRDSVSRELSFKIKPVELFFYTLVYKVETLWRVPHWRQPSLKQPDVSLCEFLSHRIKYVFTILIISLFCLDIRFYYLKDGDLFLLSFSFEILWIYMLCFSFMHYGKIDIHNWLYFHWRWSNENIWSIILSYFTL